MAAAWVSRSAWPPALEMLTRVVVGGPAPAAGIASAPARIVIASRCFTGSLLWLSPPDAPVAPQRGGHGDVTVSLRRSGREGRAVGEADAAPDDQGASRPGGRRVEAAA